MVTIIDYGVGNLTSIQNMLKKFGCYATISNDPNIISDSKKIILPGMGHFDNCMQKFNVSGLRQVVEQKVLKQNIPILGICVGLQMFMDSSEEGHEPGLGWVSGKTLKLKQEFMDQNNRIPHMGWEEINLEKASNLWEGLEISRFYFAHSYYVQPFNHEDILLSIKYGSKITIGIEKGNILGVQFHPEKSHKFGMKLLQNFVNNY